MRLHVASFHLVFFCSCFANSVAAADNRTLVIGIDGAGGSFLEAANTPNINKLISNGLVRYDYLNEGALEPTPPAAFGASGVNWSTVTTGVSAANHGVVDNSFAGNLFDQFPHYFKYIKDANAGLNTASIVTWGPINTQILDDQYVDFESEPGGTTVAQIDENVRTAVVNLLDNGNPHAIFLQFDQVDGAGHGNGWGSAPFFDALENVDQLIGDVMVAVNKRPASEDWLVIVTADHGGKGFSHTADQGPINWEVPYVISGPNVDNNSHLAKGTLRDVVPTALWHMGIDPFLLDLDGSVRGLEVLPPNGIIADVNQDGFVVGDGFGPATEDDVTAFLEGWLSAGKGSIAERYNRGDLNLDGTTDLADWAILNQQAPAIGDALLLRLRGVPEPSSILLFVLPVFATVSVRFRLRK